MAYGWTLLNLRTPFPVSAGTRDDATYTAVTTPTEATYRLDDVNSNLGVVRSKFNDDYVH